MSRARSFVLAIAVLAMTLSGCIAADPADDPPPATEPQNEPPENVTVTWGTMDTATIRPGASLGGYCTFNWLFTNSTGAAFIGTAGHCTAEPGERVTHGETGDEIGTVVYDSDNADGADPDVDFSLVLLDADQVTNAHPAMLGWNGPHGIIEPEATSAGDQVAIHGYGMVLGQQEATRDRFGALISADEKYYVADMPAVNGDSGSPLIHVETGQALGIISHYGFGATPPSTDEGPVMTFIMAELAKAGWDVELALA